MSKIGILTHYYRAKNIGGLLQAYALPAFLRAQGLAAEQLAFDGSGREKQARKILGRLALRKLLKDPLLGMKRFYQKCRNRKIAVQIRQQDSVFEAFEQFVAHAERVYNGANINQANAYYDAFITGSDQVFASYLVTAGVYYGEFAAPDKKVISYAASSNVKQFSPEIEQLFVQKLARLNAVSVREKTLQNYIGRISDKKAEVVLDPTFLLSPKMWLEIANAASIPQKPYIFCYFLGGKSAWQRQKARAYADQYGYELVHLPFIMRSIRPADRALRGQARFDVGPREFIALISGAQAVFTDSFHGMAFAINFGKNFYVFDRDDASGAGSMNARITDTLEMLGLGARRITDKNAVLDNAPLDFARAHEILEKQKRFSAQWLLDALN